MRAEPPAEVVKLLERLGFATAGGMRAARQRAMQLAGDLPLFPSIWVDALAQGRAITHFQAAEINAGRGERLAVGPYALIELIESIGYAECFRAREVGARRDVRLLTATVRTAARLGFLPDGDEERTRAERNEVVNQISALAPRMAHINNRSVVRPDAAGVDDERLWIAYPVSDARPVRNLVLRSGRLPGNAVLEIARQMVAALADLEVAGIVHGDISASSVAISIDGRVELSDCGIRGILRPIEGFDYADLPPEAYDYLAPERVANGEGPNVKGDLFGCGCVWWHLLTSRPPLMGGTSLGKLRAAQAAKIIDVRRFAPDAPAALVAAIATCTQRDPRRRPESFAALASMLGQSTSAGRRAVENALARRGRGKRGVANTVSRVLRSKETPAWVAAIVGCVAIVAIVAWPLWRTQPKSPVALVASRNEPAASGGAKSGTRRADATSDAKPRDGVVQAEFLDPDAPIRRAQPMVLPSGEATTWNPASRALEAGQTVRGRPGERPLVVVPPEGIVVAVEGVQFDSVDFVWRQSPDAAIDPQRVAIIDLRAASASFRGCTFQAAANERFGRPIGIAWNGPRRARALPPAGRLQMSGCVLSGVAAGIDCRFAAPLAIKISDMLDLGAGPLLRLDRAPRIDEPIEIVLNHSTLRDSAALIGFHIERLPTDEPGTIGITTNDCVFAPSRDGALVLFATPARPTTLAKALQWSGQGSLLAANSRVGDWLKAGRPRSEEVEISVDGLVSGQVQFAGPADAGSSASRVTRWLAPVQSAEPPGIPEGLPNLPRMP
jgi:eukaryotic-like serine/threonine-protein kinase